MGRQASPRPGSVTAIRPPCPARMAFRFRGPAQGPDRAFEVQLAGVGLGDHAVEVAARGGPEMLASLLETIASATVSMPERNCIGEPE
jgi:hypothetical protein